MKKIELWIGNLAVALIVLGFFLYRTTLWLTSFLLLLFLGTVVLLLAVLLMTLAICGGQYSARQTAPDVA
jgi:hypothetical protein